MVKHSNRPPETTEHSQVEEVPAGGRETCELVHTCWVLVFGTEFVTLDAPAQRRQAKAHRRQAKAHRLSVAGRLPLWIEFHWNQPRLLAHVSSIAAFVLQWQGWEVKTETSRAIMPEMFSVWPVAEKVRWPRT